MKTKRRFVIASNNQAKTAELVTCFAYLGYQAISYQQLIGRHEFPSEGTQSYQKNAQGKANFIARLLPDEWIVADDSGMLLAADPDGLGVQTARQLKMYTDTEHHLNQRILAIVANKSREVTMTTTLVLRTPIKSVIGHGEFHGTIATEERGQNGASFDLILVPDGMHQTLAELSDAVKLPLLHRTKAIADLMTHMEETTHAN